VNPEFHGRALTEELVSPFSPNVALAVPNFGADAFAFTRKERSKEVI
jgi:hypothetical protein